MGISIKICGKILRFSMFLGESEKDLNEIATSAHKGPPRNDMRFLWCGANL